jgi:hypothetical protein
MEHIVTINAIELASELADARIKKQLTKYLQLDINTNVYTYTDEAQDLFNEYFDEYLTMIEETKEPKPIIVQVYGVKLVEMPREDALRFHLNLSDDDFITSAEEQGYVWSLDGYTKQYNMDTLPKLDFIRFVNLTDQIK